MPEAQYNFASTASTSVEKFISVAQLLENTGVLAYDGVITHIETAALLSTGATIATIEARHASYLNLLNRDVPFPAAFGDTATPREVCRTVDEAFSTSAPELYGPYASL